MFWQDLKIDKSWTLFLDRDGVLNENREGDYVKIPEELQLIPGAAEAISQLNELFGLTIIVTNQQGIGKGLMSRDDLFTIHQLLLTEINKHMGKVDAIYYSDALAGEGDPSRKPGTGMALNAKKDFPQIQFEKAVMVGDSLSDIQFGNTLGMITVKIGDRVSEATFHIDSLAQLPALIADIP